MTTCSIVAAIVSCILHGPVLSPRQAVDIFQSSMTPFVYVAPLPPRLPEPISVAAPQRANMSGPWDWPEPRPERRLDGTLLSDPPTVFGIQPWYPYLLGPYPAYRPPQPREAHPRTTRRP